MGSWQWSVEGSLNVIKFISQHCQSGKSPVEERYGSRAYKRGNFVR